MESRPSGFKVRHPDRILQTAGEPVAGFWRPRGEVGVIGVVLAGGRSSRLGLDKVRLRLGGAGKPDMLHRTLALLAACTDELAVSCRAGSAFPELEPFFFFRPVPDLLPDLGPLGGLYSCLRALGGPLLVLSCDLPFMEESVLRRLLLARETRRPEQCLTTFQQSETGYIEALVSVYEPECLPWFEKALSSGLRRLNLVVPAELRAHVPYGREESLPFFNVNEPADLELALRYANPS